MRIVAEGRLWADLLVEEVCMPKGRLGDVPAADRAGFLRDRRFVAGMGLSRIEGGVTILDRSGVAAADWLPGTLAVVYAIDPRGDLGRQIAVKEHVAGPIGLHPSAVRWLDGEACAHALDRPYPVHVADDGACVRVSDGGSPCST